MESVAIFYANQCDKKKCTSIRIKKLAERLSFRLHWTENKKFIRRNSLVLTPNADQYLSPADRELYKKVGLTILDCSWNQGGEYFSWKFPNGRILPPLLAGNPVNYGKWERLTSLEALAAAFYLIDEPSISAELLDLYNWGNNFIDLNEVLLESYKSSTSNQDIKSVVSEYKRRREH